MNPMFLSILAFFSFSRLSCLLPREASTEGEDSILGLTLGILSLKTVSQVGERQGEEPLPSLFFYLPEPQLKSNNIAVELIKKIMALKCEIQVAHSVLLREQNVKY